MAKDLGAAATKDIDEISLGSFEQQKPVEQILPRYWPEWKKRLNLALVCALTFLA